MKLLISAYACEPGKGSEPGVGWNWVQALARRGYKVHVLTRTNNRAAIEAVPELPGVQFHYYDLPAWARSWKHRPGGIYLYYLLWQWGAARLARQLHAWEKFDRVHHVTFVSYRQPSFMGSLGIPFIFGPVGGGETMPASLLPTLSPAGRRAERLRNLASALLPFDPFMHRTFRKAHLIACTTAETLARIPQRYRPKCLVQPAIGINDWEIAVRGQDSPGPHFLFVGRLLYWKGLHLAFEALAHVRKSVPDVRLRIVGQGEDRTWLESRAEAAGVTDLLEWVPSVPHDAMAEAYRSSTALVFPSLHDSGGMVVLESLAAGLPVLCLDLGGPGALATPECACVVKTRDASPEAIVRALAEAMILLATNPQLRRRLSANAITRARQLTWDRAAEAVCASAEHASDRALG